uniref:Uncharacterized protein n=1 Tax=Arundo donax TaxID=35708 RepID=A0A0A9BY95_ARUDO
MVKFMSANIIDHTWLRFMEYPLDDCCSGLSKCIILV